MISDLTNFLPSNLIEDLDRSLSSELSTEQEANEYCYIKPNGGEDDNNISETNSTTSSQLNEKSIIKGASLINTYFSGDLLSLFSKQKSAFFFQKLLYKLSHSELGQVIGLFKGQYAQIIEDPYGNYFCSDLFKLASKAQRLIILNELSVDLPKIVFNQYGTHPIQTLIQMCSSFEEQSLLVKHIDSVQVIIEMCLNENGTYVIQKMLQYIKNCLTAPICQTIIDNFLLLAMDMNGVCVIKSLMQITISPVEREVIMINLIINFIPIATSTYGNYAIQHALHLWWYLGIDVLKEMIIHHFSQLAECRNSSHIAEFFISKLSQKERSVFIYHLLLTGQLALIAKSKYGVFIINQVFGFVSLAERIYIVNTLKNQS